MPGVAPVTSGPALRNTKLEAIEAAHEMERRMCEQSLHSFLQFAWPIIEPGREFIDNWHLRAICSP
jgi:hypothetical protein